MLETAAEGTAVKGRVAVGAQVADGPVLVSPGAGQAGAGRAARGAAAGRVHGVAGLALTWRPGRPLGLQSSNPALDRPFALSVLLCLDDRLCFQYLSPA